MRVLLASSAVIENYDFYKKYNLMDYDLKIAVDGGISHLVNLNIVPDVLIGDLDSIDESMIDYVNDNNIEVLKFNPEKDATDTEIALSYASNKKPSEICIIGALGGRMDHTLSVMSLLKTFNVADCCTYLLSEQSTVYYNDSYMRINGKKGDLISIVPIERIDNILIKGFKYPLDNVMMEYSTSLGISNEFEDEVGEIWIDGGSAFVILSRE